MYRVRLIAALAIAFAICCGSALAAEANATGTWKSTFKRQDGTEMTTTFKLKQDGEKLTGTVSGRNNTQTEISDGKLKDGTVSFKVVRKTDNGEFTMSYEGKLDGDTIKGKSKFGTGDNARERDWEAKREKA